MAAEDELARLDNQLADRMNGEPPILKGCSSSELLAIALLGLAFWLPACLLTGWLLGHATFAIGIAGALTAATVYGGSFVFAALKRGRPDGYYQHRVLVWLHRRRLWHCGFSLPAGPLVLGRTTPPRARDAHGREGRAAPAGASGAARG